ncbi:MAG: site-2 protease family protein [Desulfobaccales bacterium]
MTPDATPWPPEAPEAKGEEPGPAIPRTPGPLSPRRLALPLGLFLATVATTIIAGAIQQGVNPFTDPGLLYRGVPFSFTLLLILGAHEMGHYLVARRHRLAVTLPYFIPAPPIPFFIGTFGAFIRIRSPIQDKRALLDVGCAGPLIGVAVSIPVTLVGLKLSSIGVMQGGHEMLALGEPLLYQFLSWLAFGPLPAEAQVILHPVAFAGWIGMLVTSLNLIPVGQLDGGHISYALFPEYHRQISLSFLGLLLACGLIFWYGWLVWAVLLSFLGWRHPAPHYYWLPLDGRRRRLGFIAILVLALTICPTPLSLVPGVDESNSKGVQAGKAATGQGESAVVAFSRGAPPGRLPGLPWKIGPAGWLSEARLTF